MEIDEIVYNQKFPLVLSNLKLLLSLKYNERGNSVNTLL